MFLLFTFLNSYTSYELCYSQKFDLDFANYYYFYYYYSHILVKMCINISSFQQINLVTISYFYYLQGSRLREITFFFLQRFLSLFFCLVNGVGWFLWYINLCRLFNAKSILMPIISSISNNSV